MDVEETVNNSKVIIKIALEDLKPEQRKRIEESEFNMYEMLIVSPEEKDLDGTTEFLLANNYEQAKKTVEAIARREWPDRTFVWGGGKNIFGAHNGCYGTDDNIDYLDISINLGIEEDSPRGLTLKQIQETYAPCSLYHILIETEGE